MNPQIANITEDYDQLKFTLSGIEVCFMNAIRRTIIADIPIICFKTAPYEEDQSIIFTNTSRLHNEIIKLRLMAIPIHISDIKSDDILKNYILELNVENKTDTKLIVTTEHFKIKNKITGTYLTDIDTRNIFPPCALTNQFIDFLRLRPLTSPDITPEKIHLQCAFSVHTAAENACFNTSGLCSYGNSLDNTRIEKELSKKKQEWKDQGIKNEDITFRVKNWHLLEAFRIFIKDSFDFTLQTIGIYTNFELLLLACSIIINNLKQLSNDVETNNTSSIIIGTSQSTITNAFDIKLIKQGYTIGSILNTIIFNKYYTELKTMSFCSFKKDHPHDNFITLRIAYHEAQEQEMVTQNIIETITLAIGVIEKIENIFKLQVSRNHRK